MSAGRGRSPGLVSEGGAISNMWPIPSHDTCNVPIPTPRGLTDACENITSFAGGGVGTSHASSTYPTPPLGYPTPTPRISYPLAIPYTPPVYWHQVVTTKVGASAWWITRFPKIIHRHVMTFLNTRDGSTNRLRFFSRDDNSMSFDEYYN